MKPKIITITIEKGGNSKTTTTINLAYSLANKGFKIGIIDFDKQRHSSLNLQSNKGSDLASCLKKVQITKDDFSTTSNPNLFILKNNDDISEDLFNLFQADERSFILLDSLANLDGLDYVFVDTPPSLQLQAINAIVACDYIIAPVTTESFGITGLQNLLKEVNRLKQRTAPNIQILGVLISKFNKVYQDNRANISIIKQILTDNNQDDNLIFETKISQNIDIPRSQQLQQSVFDYGSVKGIEDFNNLSNEFLERIRTHNV